MRKHLKIGLVVPFATDRVCKYRREDLPVEWFSVDSNAGK